MPVIPITFALDVGASGALVDVSSYVENGDEIVRSYGRQDQFRDTEPGVYSVTLNNRDGRFTPNFTTANAAAGYSTTVTEGMAVNLSIGGRLTAGTVQSIVLPPDEYSWGQITLICDDMLGNAGRRELSTLLQSILDGATPFLFWPLSDAASTITPTELERSGTGLLTLAVTNGSTFGASAITGLTTDTQMTLKDSLAPTGGNAWPVFPFTYPTGSLGFYNFWITPTAAAKVIAAVNLSGFARTLQFGFNAGSYFVRDGDAGSTATYANSDLGAHYVSMGVTAAFALGVWTVTATLYVDGTNRGAITYADTFPTLTYLAPLGVSLTAS